MKFGKSWLIILVRGGEMSDESKDEDWEPDEDLILWMRQHCAKIGIGGVWSPDGSGCTYERIDLDTWSLVRMMEHPNAISHHVRFKKLFIAAGLEVEDENPVQYPAPMSFEESERQRLEEKREIALNWRCECHLPLAEFDLEKRIDVFIEEKDVPYNGDTHPVQIWACRIICPSCDKEVNMDPDDYQLLAGNELYMQWRDSEGGIYKAQTRIEVRDLVDSGVMGVALGSKLTGTEEKLPPWMWGTYCIYIPAGLQEKSED